MRFIYIVKQNGDLHIIMITWMNFLSGNEASNPLSNAWIRDRHNRNHNPGPYSRELSHIIANIRPNASGCSFSFIKFVQQFLVSQSKWKTNAII